MSFVTIRSRHGEALVAMFNEIGISRPELDPESTDVGVHPATYGTKYYGAYRAPMPHLSDRDDVPFRDVEDRMIAMIDGGADEDVYDAPTTTDDRYSAMAEEHSVDDNVGSYDDPHNGVMYVSVTEDDLRLAATTISELLSMLGPKPVSSDKEDVSGARSAKGLHKQALLTHGMDAFMCRPYPPSASWKDTTSAPRQHVRHKPAHSS